MRRRELMTFLSGGSRDSLERPLGAFRQSLADSGYRQAGIYVAKILRGAKPATKFDLTVNLNAANALGLSVSDQMQLLADEVIE
jgi:ABC-type uncharacterized transport system substrate-binding protein